MQIETFQKLEETFPDQPRTMQLIEDLAWWHYVSCGIFFLLQFASEESVSLTVAVGALRKHHSQESGHALMQGAQLKQQAFTSRGATSSNTSNSGWHGGAPCLNLPYKGGREDSTTFPKISSTRQHFSSIRQHFLKFLRLGNISRRFGNLFLCPVKIENVVDSTAFLVDSTTFLEFCLTRQLFPFWREL